MLGYVWAGLIIVSVLSGILLGNTESLSTALIESGSSSIELLLTMAGILCLWSGIMKIAEESGFTALISKIFAPLLRPLFPKLDKTCRYTECKGGPGSNYRNKNNNPVNNGKRASQIILTDVQNRGGVKLLRQERKHDTGCCKKQDADKNCNHDTGTDRIFLVPDFF